MIFYCIHKCLIYIGPHRKWILTHQCFCRLCTTSNSYIHAHQPSVAITVASSHISRPPTLTRIHTHVQITLADSHPHSYTRPLTPYVPHSRTTSHLQNQCGTGTVSMLTYGNLCQKFKRRPTSRALFKK